MRGLVCFGSKTCARSRPSRVLAIFHCLMSSTLGYLVSQKCQVNLLLLHSRRSCNGSTSEKFCCITFCSQLSLSEVVKDLVWDNIFVSVDIIFEELMIWFQCLSTLLVVTDSDKVDTAHVQVWQLKVSKPSLWSFAVTILMDWGCYIIRWVCHIVGISSVLVLDPYASEHYLTLASFVRWHCTWHYITLSSVRHICCKCDGHAGNHERSLFCKARVSWYLGLCMLVPAFLVHRNRTRPTCIHCVYDSMYL